MCKQALATNKKQLLRCVFVNVQDVAPGIEVNIPVEPMMPEHMFPEMEAMAMEPVAHSSGKLDCLFSLLGGGVYPSMHLERGLYPSMQWAELHPAFTSARRVCIPGMGWDGGCIPVCTWMVGVSQQAIGKIGVCMMGACDWGECVWQRGF